MVELQIVVLAVAGSSPVGRPVGFWELQLLSDLRRPEPRQRIQCDVVVSDLRR